MKTIHSVSDINFEGRHVFLRVDFNVPMQKGVILSDARIKAVLPTIQYIVEKGGNVALASHLGRPNGKRKPEFSLEAVGARLAQLLNREVVLADDCIGDGVKALVRGAHLDAVILLENLRFHAEEEANDAEFSKALAAPFDVYINDAFGASHRAHASIVGMVKHFALRDRGAGFLLGKEFQALTQLLHEPARPFVAVVGGAKVSDKVGVLESLLKRVNTICIGGAMAYTFLKARNVEVGASRVEEDKVRIAKEILHRAKDRDVEIVLPVDHIAANSFDENATPTLVTQANMPEGLMGLDIGPVTRRHFSEVIAKAATVFWNGPMGVFEWERYAAGTRAIAQAMAETSAFTVVGGGDSVAAVEAANVADKMGHISTGGGASLELLQYETLPGLEALKG
jgi:phosphoglycerate kinase